MKLESRKVSETQKPLEETKNEYLERNKLKKIIESLPTVDIDQQWIRENESKEFTFSTQQQKNDINPRVDDLSTQMNEIGSFGKTAKTANSSTKELFFEKLNNNKPQSIIPQPQEIISQTENISSQSQEINDTFLSNSEPPINDSVSPIKEETKPEEVIVDNNALALIEELSDKIDKKYKQLISELSNLYNSEKIKQEANVIKSDLQSLMNIKERSIEELKKVDDALNNLISRFAKLAQKADEIKTSDDFKISQQNKQLKTLEDYQNNLQKRYGNYWFGKMTNQEEEQYINLYAVAHKVPREVVKKQIDDSIAIAYKEIIANTELKKQQQEQVVFTESQTNIQEFEGNYENLIKFNGRQALETLKQIHSNLNTATSEQVEEFNYLYSALSALSKFKPTNYEEEQQKLTQLYNLTDKIDQLQSSLNNVSVKSR